jgi:hypothetical protein
MWEYKKLAHGYAVIVGTICSQKKFKSAWHNMTTSRQIKWGLAGWIPMILEDGVLFMTSLAPPIELV